MLEIKPNCECCDCDLPPSSDEAMICTFECTFCRDCVETKLNFVCPKCGGDFVPRTIRPARLLEKYPPSTKRIYKPEVCVAAIPVERSPVRTATTPEFIVRLWLKGR